MDGDSSSAVVSSWFSLSGVGGGGGGVGVDCVFQHFQNHGRSGNAPYLCCVLLMHLEDVDNTYSRLHLYQRHSSEALFYYFL